MESIGQLDLCKNLMFGSESALSLLFKNNDFGYNCPNLNPNLDEVILEALIVDISSYNSLNGFTVTNTTDTPYYIRSKNYWGDAGYS